MKPTDIHRFDRLPARFWSKVDKGGPNGCWVWTASLFITSGYGNFGVYLDDGQHMFGAHRVSYMLKHGEVPDHLDVCHTCDNKPCVNPAHLFLGTNADNIKDAYDKGLVQAPIYLLTGSARPTAKLTAAQAIEVVRLFDTGQYTKIELGEQFGVTGELIKEVVHGRRYAEDTRLARQAQTTPPSRRARGPEGERHHRAKLTDAQAQEIRTLHAAGTVDRREIARNFGVNVSTVYRIGTGKTYKARKAA